MCLLLHLPNYLCQLTFSFVLRYEGGYGGLTYLSSRAQNGEEAMGVVPVLNIPAGEYALKTEVTHWLQKHGIFQNSLMFR